MIRAAIYARFSSDLQNEKSIDDQIALCRDVCAREGMAVISTFEDRAISGTGAINRPGFQALMRAAEAKLFDVIVAEDMDRLFRDQADYHNARKQLDFIGISIHTASGRVGRLDGSLRALMGEMFVENLVIHTRRGLEGVIRDGRHAGGRAYGFRPVAGKPGELQIVEAEAEVIRQIYTDYIAGKTPRQIAIELNQRGIQPPRGTRWSASSINGNYGRGGGLLMNDLYNGRIVWNRVRMIKDPVTRKRLSRPNPKEQWKIAEAPHLKIIDDETFRAAQALKAKRHHEPKHKAKIPKRIFSGLIKCGSCGGGMTSVGKDRDHGIRLQCSAHRESGTCSNGRKVYVEEIEKRVLDGLRRELMHPDLIAAYVDTYNAERKRLKKQAMASQAKHERRLGEIQREERRLVDILAKTDHPPESIGPRLWELKHERDAINVALETAKADDKVVTLHPKALSRYKTAVADLAAEMTRGKSEANAATLAIIRELITAIVVHAAPSKAGGDIKKEAEARQVRIEIRGRLAAICGDPGLFPNMPSTGGRMVAGEGLEPPTPGL